MLYLPIKTHLKKKKKKINNSVKQKKRGAGGVGGYCFNS